jgi:hypothetical protein
MITMFDIKEDGNMDKALSLLRSLHADISECRRSGYEFDVDDTRFKWPNLAILDDKIKAFLAATDRGTA